MSNHFHEKYQFLSFGYERKNAFLQSIKAKIIHFFSEKERNDALKTCEWMLLRILH
jgi:hypothetical protein